MNSQLSLGFIMFFIGVSIPVLAAVNGGLGIRLENPVMATATAVVVAALLLVLTVVLTGQFRIPFSGGIPLYFYVGGAIVACYMLGITVISPRFGVANTLVFVILGQLISMAMIEHFGLIGAMHNPLSLTRLGGILLMAIGVFMVVAPNTMQVVVDAMTK